MVVGSLTELSKIFFDGVHGAFSSVFLEWFSYIREIVEKTLETFKKSDQVFEKKYFENNKIIFVIFYKQFSQDEHSH